MGSDKKSKPPKKPKVHKQVEKPIIQIDKEIQQQIIQEEQKHQGDVDLRERINTLMEEVPKVDYGKKEVLTQIYNRL